MSALDDLKSAEATREANDAAELSLLQNIKAQLDALIAAGTGSVSAADLQVVIDQMTAANTKQADDIAANTPAS